MRYATMMMPLWLWSLGVWAETDFDPINEVRPDNPFNPINEVNPNNPLNPINRYNPNTPFRSLNNSLNRQR